MWEYIQSVIVLLLTYTIPSVLIFLTFSMAVFGFPLRENLGKAIIFTVLVSITGIWFVHLFTMMTQFFYYAFVYFCFFLILFRRWTWLQRWSVSVLAFVLNLLNEGLWFTVAIRSASREELMTNAGLIIRYLWPSLGVFALITLVLARTELRQGATRLIKRMDGSRTVLLTCLILFFVIQIVLSTIYFSIQFEMGLSTPSAILHTLFFSGMICSMLLLIVTARIIRHSSENAVRSAHEVYKQEVDNMYNAIRGQRHDFLNHIQVIASMLSNRKFEEADKYITDLYQDTRQIRDWIDIGHPGFSALIQSKMALAVSNGIRLDYTFSGLEHMPNDIKSIDVVRISGNLLDNAIEAVSELSIADRWVEITGVSAEDHLYIAVRNPGPVLKEEQIRQCFAPGYTTKTNRKNKGLGLQIVRKKVEEYKGTLQARSNEVEGTVFTVRIPF